MSRILVIRDRDPAALCNPLPEVFGGQHAVAYRHLSQVDDISDADHLVFNCERLPKAAHDLIERGLDRRTAVTVIIRHPDDRLVRIARCHPVNVIPAYGLADQITNGTMRRSLRLAIGGTPVFASGFVAQSTGARPQAFDGGSVIAELLDEASTLARNGERIVVAILAQQRTGSKFLHDMLGWTVSGDVEMFHEHEVPGSDAPIDGDRPLFDQLALELDPKRRMRLRRAILRRKLLDAERRFIFVSERPPRARLTSYFMASHRAMLRELFDRERGSFTDVNAVATAFESFLRLEFERKRGWYHSQLQVPFELNVLDATPTIDGVRLVRSGPNTLVVVPIEKLDPIRDQLGRAYGTDSYHALHTNSAATLGASDVATAVRAHVTVDQGLFDRFWEIPEVAHIHQESADVPS